MYYQHKTKYETPCDIIIKIEKNGFIFSNIHSFIHNTYTPHTLTQIIINEHLKITEKQMALFYIYFDLNV